MEFRDWALIDGHSSLRNQGGGFTVSPPAGAAVLASMAECDAADVDLAVAAGRLMMGIDRAIRLQSAKREAGAGRSYPRKPCGNGIA